MTPDRITFWKYELINKNEICLAFFSVILKLSYFLWNKQLSWKQCNGELKWMTYKTASYKYFMSHLTDNLDL